MTRFVLSASASLPGVAIDGRALQAWRQEMDRQLRELEQRFGGDSDKGSRPPHASWESRRRRPR